MIRFTNAVTLFSMQQMQNAIGAVTDSQAVINRFCTALDAISNTLSTQIDAYQKSTLDSMTKTGSEMVDRTMDAMNAGPEPREIMDTTADVMRKTSDSMLTSCDGPPGRAFHHLTLPPTPLKPPRRGKNSPASAGDYTAKPERSNSAQVRITAHKTAEKFCRLLAVAFG